MTLSSAKPTGWGATAVAQPTLAEIDQAAQRIAGHIVRTPLVPLHTYSTTTDLWLKPETLQPVRSYKLRGVLNWASTLSQGQRAQGFSTHSAGNTAQALGYVAQLFGVPARSLLPDTAPAVKIEAIRRYGATPIPLPFSQLLDFVFSAGWEREPYTFLNPWGDPHLLAGYATIGLEILADLPNVQTVFVPVGCGGLIGGVGSAIKALNPAVRVIGVQSAACPALHASLAAGKPVWVTPQPTLCDGTNVPLAVDVLFPLLQQVVDEVVLVSETAVKAAIKRLALHEKLIVEGSGALSVAAALATAVVPRLPGATPRGKRGQTVCILSGGSIDTDKLREILRD